MPRATRIHFPGAVFHVISRGNDQQNIFHDDSDWRVFLRVLSRVKENTGYKLYAYCLMSNHFHLLLEVNRTSLSAIMQSALTQYSRYFNDKRDRSGHLFQGRYSATICGKGSYFLGLLRYIHLNPVKARIIQDPRDWPWSGHNGLLAQKQGGLLDTQFPLSLFHHDIEEAQRTYEIFVLSGIDPTTGDVKIPHGISEGEKSHRIGIKMDPSASEIGLGILRDEYANGNNQDLSGLRKATKGWADCKARRDFAKTAVGKGYRPSEIAAYLNISRAAVTKMLKPGS